MFRRYHRISECLRMLTSRVWCNWKIKLYYVFIAVADKTKQNPVQRLQNELVYADNLFKLTHIKKENQDSIKYAL